MSEVFAAEAALVGERADDLARLDLVSLPDFDAIGGEAFGGVPRAAVAFCAIGAVITERASLAGVAAVFALARLPGKAGIIRRQQQGSVSLRDDGECRRNIRFAHVVVFDVVGDDVAVGVEVVLVAERLGDGVVEARQPGDVDVFDAGQLHLDHRLSGCALDLVEQSPLAWGDEADGGAAASRPAGAPDAVHVGLGVDGDVVVDDVADAVHVEAAGGDIRGHQDVEFAVLQLLDGALALGLRYVAADGGGRVAAGAQLLGEGFGLVLGADEDDHPFEVFDLEDAREGVDLLRVGHDEVALAGVGRRGRLAFDGDFLGVVQVFAGDSADLRGHGRREQGDLFVVGGVFEDRFDILGEAHFEHLVGLIQHQVFELGEVEGAFVEVVHDAAGRADDDVHPAAEGAELGAVALATVDRQHVHAFEVGGVPLERLADLQCELAGGCEHERLRDLLAEVETIEDGECEGGRLAGSRLGDAEHVTPLQQGRDGRGLDRRRGFVSDILQRPKDATAEPQVFERDGGRFGLGGIFGAHAPTLVALLFPTGRVAASSLGSSSRAKPALPRPSVSPLGSSSRAKPALPRPGRAVTRVE